MIEALDSLSGLGAGYWAPKKGAPNPLDWSADYQGMRTDVSRRNLVPATDGMVGFEYRVAFLDAPYNVPLLEVAAGSAFSLTTSDPSTYPAESVVIRSTLFRPGARIADIPLQFVSGSDRSTILYSNASAAALQDALESMSMFHRVRAERQASPDLERSGGAEFVVDILSPQLLVPSLEIEFMASESMLGLEEYRGAVATVMLASAGTGSPLVYEVQAQAPEREVVQVITAWAPPLANLTDPADEATHLRGGIVLR